MQPVEAFGDEPGPPAVHGRPVDAEVGRGLLVRPALRAAQHDLGSQREELGGLRPPRPLRQLPPLDLVQDQVGLRPPDPAGVLKPGHPRCGESPTPLAHRLGLDTNDPCDTCV